MIAELPVRAVPAHFAAHTPPKLADLAGAHKAGCAALTGAHSGAPVGSVPWKVAHLCAAMPTA